MSRWRTNRRTPRRLVAGRYDLRSEQGHDAQGILWRGIDTLLRRDVVVKEITLGDDLPDAEREGFDRRVLREARAVARISHPGVATLFDVIQEHGHTFIVTERSAARTLAQVVESDGPLPPERVASLGHQLIGALQAAHRRGILHR